MGQVVLKGINKFYDSVHAVKDVNLQIRDKEFVVFVGPSGCGKTTTLRMIAGLEAISSGDISIDGNVVNELAPMDRDIAMVFQNYALYPHMSVYDNMAFGLKMRKFEKPEIDKRVREAADILGIGELLTRKPRQLSGGQRQRVALGRAIVRHPRVFLFDEPLSNLDAKLRVQMRVELKKLHLRLGTTAIYVTHDQVEAMTLGDRVVVMKDGVVQQVGEPLELYNQPANKFVAGFIGSPAMNFAAVTVTEANGSLIAENSGLRIKLPDETAQRLRGHIGHEVTLGVRPEDLTVAGGADLDQPVLRCRDRGGRATRLGNPARYEGRRGCHGGERRADRAGEGARQAARCHASFQASRFRREDRGGNRNGGSAHLQEISRDDVGASDADDTPNVRAGLLGDGRCGALANHSACPGRLVRPPAHTLDPRGLADRGARNMDHFQRRRRPVLRDECASVMAAFFEAGGRMINSSPMYGSSQPVIGYGLQKLGRPSTLFSAEKVWTSSATAGPAQIEQSRRFWGVPKFDLVQVHNLARLEGTSEDTF